VFFHSAAFLDNFLSAREKGVPCRVPSAICPICGDTYTVTIKGEKVFNMTCWKTNCLWTYKCLVFQKGPRMYLKTTKNVLMACAWPACDKSIVCMRDETEWEADHCRPVSDFPTLEERVQNVMVICQNSSE